MRNPISMILQGEEIEESCIAATGKRLEPEKEDTQCIARKFGNDDSITIEPLVLDLMDGHSTTYHYLEFHFDLDTMSY